MPAALDDFSVGGRGRAERVGGRAAARREAREAGRRAVAQVPLDGVVLELAVAVALEEDLAGARQLRVEEALAGAAAPAMAW